MNILVCIKQVPGTTQIEVDEKTGVLKRDGVESKMNPFDLYALESALRLKQQYNAKVSVITMGPPQAELVVREAFMMGVDEGYILSDRRFGGADVLATSYTLFQGIKKVGAVDLIICGKQTTDGDTAQVGPELAEWLQIVHAVNVCKIDSLNDNDITLNVDLGTYIETEKIKLPALITVEKGICEPRLPSFRLKLATKERQINWLNLDDLDDKDPKHYGLNGSPTQVQRIFPPESSVEHLTLEGDDELKAQKICDILSNKKFLQ